MNDVIAFQIGQMRSPHRWLDARRCRSSWHYKSAIIHVQTIASANKFIRGVSRERAIGFSTKVRFVKRVIKAYAYSRDVLKGTLTSFVAIFINASARLFVCSPIACICACINSVCIRSAS